MEVIPVIDVSAGRVVRAVRGERAAYRPIESALCLGSEPVAVASILCRHCAARRLYIADLDALTGHPVQRDMLEAVAAALPGLALWIDAGLHDASAAADLLTRLSPPVAARTVPVCGSESLRPGVRLADWPRGAETVLSLDRKGGAWLDPAAVWATPGVWPSSVIVMTLDAVGADAGPDLAVLAQVRARAPGARLIGSGGIRDERDLHTAAAAGADAWLVASALHDGRLTAR